MQIDLVRLATDFADVEFFVACIFPQQAPVFGEDIPSTLHVVDTPHFWSISAKAPQSGQSLVNRIGDDHVLFRGYESDLSVHSYSSGEKRDALLDPSLLRNGVFAYVKANANGKSAQVRSDALGVSPLFYREQNGVHYLSSHPSLIYFDGDQPDLTSWVALLQNNFTIADRSFYEGIHRFPAGSQLDLTITSSKMSNWLEVAALPEGIATIDDQAFEVVEAAYLAGIEKCMKLDVGAVTLPFSSGYDSRRFFASLVNKQASFSAVTCQTFHRKPGGDYDIDSFYAPKIAAAFGVECTLVQATPSDQVAADHQRRMSLIGTETFMHGWAVPFMRWLSARPSSVVIDGLAGDTLGNSGFEFDGLHQDGETDTNILLRQTVHPHVFRQLSKIFPSQDEYSEKYNEYLRSFPPTLNRAELAFLQLRTRRSISPWITMMHPPGQVVVFPYYDMAFVQATLSYHPGEKYRWFFQKECLKRFYPEYFDFHGSRNLPTDLAPRPAAQSTALDDAEDAFVYGDWSVVMATLKYLKPMNRVLLILAVLFKGVRKRRGWLFRNLLLLVKTQKSHRPFLHV